MGAFPLLQLIAALAALAPASLLAMHDVRAPAHQAAAWSFEPWLVALLAASALLYAMGVRALWRKAGTGRGIRGVEAARFAAGWLVLVTALLSPLDALAARSFAAHMVQHELLMVVAAPLLVLARPLEAWAWALAPILPSLRSAFAGASLLPRAWSRLTEPVGAWCFHAVALWTWHLPALFVLALADNGVHALQHGFFFGSALAFWWAAFGRASRAAEAISLVGLLTTMLHSGALGALLTFAPTPWYFPEGLSVPWGLTALEDQQLGGLVMWVPGSFAYLVAALAIVARWLARPEARAAVR